MVPNKKERAYQQFAARLNKACDDIGLPKRGRSKLVGAMVGVGYKGAEKWLNGLGMPDMGHATELAKELRKEFDWLMTGRGSEEPRTLAEIREEEDHPPKSKLSDTELQELSKAWPHMPKEIKNAIRALVDSGEWDKQKKKRGPKH